VLVANEAARACTDLSLSFGKPVTLGIIGPRATKAHAESRKAAYAKRAVAALQKLL
jgi:6,7-dimethyl-8-ribityllumazine synthase